jgi:4-amino-4-deoxy-L-arabinose transferase-like glycosyltransferase
MAVALALRLLWALWVPVEPTSDSHLYHEFARSIAEGRGYAYPDGHLTAYWPVGTSAAYAALYVVFGVRFAPVVALNIALGVAIVALTHRLARTYLGEPVARAAAWIVAAWPLLIEFTTVLASELLFIALLLAALCAVSARAFGPATRGLLYGLLLCGAMYVRPTASPLFLLVPAAQWWNDRRTRDAVVTAVAALLVAVALLAPWAARNHRLFGAPTPVSTNFGANLWMGNNPRSDGGYMPLPARSMGNEAQRDATLKTEAIDFIREHPVAYVRLSLRRLVETFSRETIGVVWNEAGLRRAGAAHLATPLKALSSGYWLTMLAAAAAGVGIALRAKLLPAIHPLTLTPLLFVAVPVLTVSQDRYHMPLIPFVALYAAVAARTACTRWNPRP